MSNKKGEKTGPVSNSTEEEAKNLFEQERKRKGSIINDFYESVLPNAHPYLKDFSEGLFLQAIQMGMGMQDLGEKAKSDPSLEEQMQKEVSKMRATFNGMGSMTAADIFKQEMRNTEKTSDDE